jgi:hypothetical protein
MSDSQFFVLTDGARNVPIAGWPVEGGWWAIAVEAASGISVGWPYRLFSSAVWRDGETEIHECRKVTKWKPRYLALCGSPMNGVLRETLCGCDG